jgi:hypothetical protein
LLTSELIKILRGIIDSPKGNNDLMDRGCGFAASRRDHVSVMYNFKWGR